MHFCADEMMAIMASMPFLGILGKKLHAWWHAKRCPHAPVADNKICDPVRYFSDSEIADAARQGPPGYFEGLGWYFFDETWTYAHGPFETEAKCRLALEEYCKTL